MKTKVEQFPANNPNPVLSVANDGTVLYSNQAGEPLLHEWGVKVGGKLPSYVEDFVQKVISLNSPEKMEVNVGKRVYLVAFHPLLEEECVNIYGFEISDQKELEEKYHNIVEKSMPCQALLDENHALRDEIQSLRARLEEPEELQRAIREGDLDALVMPVSEEDIMVFTLNSADQAYRTLLETANEDVLIVDAEFKITYAGKRLLDKMGYSQEEVIGRPLIQFIGREYKNFVEQRMEERRKGVSDSYESKLISRDGSPYWAIVSAKPLFDNDGNFTGTLAMLTDITERKRAEEALQESEDRYHRLFDSMKEGFLLAELIRDDAGKPVDFCILEANLAYESVLGCKREEAIGRTLFEMFPQLSHDRFEAITAVAQTGEPLRWQGLFEPTKRYYENVYYSPRPGQLAGIFTDITERKRAEEELIAAHSQIQSIIDNTPDIIYAFDLEERFLLANTALANIFNSTPDRMIGKRRHEFMPKMDADWHEANDRQAFEEGSVLEFEESSHLKDRSITWLTKKFPLRDAQGRIYAVAGISADITERKRAEKALQKQAELIDLTPDGIVVLHLDGTITFWNQGAQALYGWTSQEAIGQQAHTLLKTRFSQPLEQIIEQVQQTGYWSGELTHFTKDGRQVFVQSRWQAKLGDQGNVREIMESNVDVTERKQAEEALRKSEYQMARAQEIALMGSWEVDVKTNLVTGSRELYEIWELDPESWGMDTFTGKIHPDDRQHNNDNINAAIYGHKPYDEEFRILTSKGERIIHSTGKTIYNEYNRPITFFGIVQDITERKRAEEALRESEKRTAADLDAMKRLHKLGILFMSESNLEPVLGEIVDAAIAISGADFGNIQLLGPESSDLKIAARRGFPKWWLDFWDSVSKGKGTCGTALGRRERVIVEDVEQSPIFAGTPALEIQLKAGVRAVQSTPLMSRSGKLLGMFSTHYKTPQRPDDHVLRLLDLLACQAAGIIEHKQAEAALQESEERMRHIARTGRIGFVEWNAAKDTGYWSREHHEIFGYEPGSQMPWEQWVQGVHPDDRERVMANASQLLDRGRSEGQVRGHKDEYRFVRPDGNVVWIESDMSVDMVGGNPIIRGSVRDITERKKAEEALWKSESNLKKAQEIAHIGSWEWDLESNLVTGSDELYRMFGLKPDQATFFQQYIALLVPEDKQRVLDALDETIERNVPYNIDYQVILDNGNKLSIHAEAITVYDKGRPVKIIGVAQDITEHKAAEEKLAAAYSQIQSIIDNTPDVIYAFDLEERFLLANTALANIFNSTPDRMIGKRRHEFMPKMDADWHEANDQQVFEAGRVLEFEEYSQLEDRSITWLTKKFPLRDAQGRIYAVAGVSADITERKRVEEKLRYHANLIENVSDAIISTDKELKIQSWNKAAERMYGWQADEVIGLKESDVLQATFPEGLSREAIAKDIFEKGHWEGELIQKTKDGRDLTVYAKSIALKDEAGVVIGGVSISSDITERKRAENALKESESRLQIVIANSPDIIFEQDRDLRYIWIFNPESPLSVSDFLGKTDAELLPPDQAQQLESIKRRVLDTGMSERAILQLAPGGEPRWYEAIYEPRYDSAGQIISVLSYTRDITERQQAQELLAYQANLLANISDVVYSTDDQLRLVSLNQAAEKVYGWKKEEVLGKNVIEVTGSAFNPEMRARLITELHEKGSVTAEIEHTTRSGKHIIFDSNTMILRDTGGKVVGYIAVNRDITDRKLAEKALRESEERFRTMANTIPQLAWTAQPDGYIYWYNERWYAYTGTTPEQMEGWGWQSVHDPALLPKVLEQWKASIASGQEFDMEFPLRGADGLYRQFLTRGFPLKDAKGQVLQWFGTNTDITERKRMEEIQEAINSINQIIHSTLGFDEIMQKTVSEAAKAVGSDSAVISLRKDGCWIVSYVLGFPEDIIGKEMNDEEELHAVLAIKTRKPVVINDVLNDERVNRNHMKKWGIRSVLVVPLITKNEVIGVIFFNCHKSIFAFDNIHVDFATRLGSSISLALENSLLFKKLKTELSERKKAGNELHEAYEKIQKQSEELQVFNEELQVQSEELHEANEALHESEKRFRTLTENSPDVITRFDRENRHTYANPAASEAYGFSQEEIIGKTQGELGMNPELVKFLETYQEIVFTIGKPETIEFQYKSPQGEEHYFSTKIVPEFVNGKMSSVLVISRDIKDLKETEAKLKDTLDKLEELVKERTVELEKAYISLKESERGLAEAQKMAHLGSWDWNIKTGEIYWSDEVYHIFGFKPPEFGVTYDVFLSYVHTDDRDFVVNAVRQALNGEFLDIEHRIVLADGVERIVHEQGEVVCDDENTPVLRGTVQDITERKKIEKTLELANAYNRSLIEASIDSFVTIGPNGKITDANNSTELITGYSRYELIGTDFSDYFTEPKKAREGHQHVFQKGSVRNYPLEIQHKNGNITPVLYNASVYREEAGNVVGVFAAAHDITELKKAEEYLAKIEIARKQEIHHRIKNNLQVISSLLDLQAEKFRDIDNIKDSEVLKAFRESQNRVISMALIHEELYKGGGFDSLDFSPYIRKLAENLFETYSLGNLDVSLNMDLEENLFFDMDTAVPLGIIVNELISNSLKHAFIERDKGEIRIKFDRGEFTEFKTEDCESTSFTLTVSDNGVGIPENFDLEKLDSLGMQLVTSLVDQLDGEFELKRNNGTEFIIRFTVIKKINQESASAPQQLFE